MNPTTKKSLSILGAAAIGAAAGILLAPAKGKDTRNKIKTKAGDAKAMADQKFSAIKKDVQSKYNTVAEKFSENVKAGKEQILAKADDAVNEIETELDAFK